MWGWILDRLVERAIPPDIENPEQERIAEEAAENAIRQTWMVAGAAGVIVVVALGAMLYALLPSQPVVQAQAPAKPSEILSQVEADDARFRQAKEESERKLDQMTIERDKLQANVATLERRVAELTKQTQTPSTTRVTAAAPDAPDREELQGKAGDLERRVADLTKKLQATKTEAARENVTQIPRPAAGSSKTPAVASARNTYLCGDGRTVRNPASCRGASITPAPRAEESRVEESIPTTYFCGDGRTVPNPAACRAAAGPPRG